MVVSPEEIKSRQQEKAKKIEEKIDNILVKGESLENITVIASIFDEVNSNVKEEILDKYKKVGWDIKYSIAGAFDPLEPSAYIFKQKKN